MVNPFEIAAERAAFAKGDWVGSKDVAAPTAPPLENRDLVTAPFRLISIFRWLSSKWGER